MPVTMTWLNQMLSAAALASLTVFTACAVAGTLCTGSISTEHAVSHVMHVALQSAYTAPGHIVAGAPIIGAQAHHIHGASTPVYVVYSAVRFSM